MSRPIAQVPDPALDRVSERVVDAPREFVWRAWTTNAQGCADPAEAAARHRICGTVGIR